MYMSVYIVRALSKGEDNKSTCPSVIRGADPAPPPVKKTANAHPQLFVCSQVATGVQQAACEQQLSDCALSGGESVAPPRPLKL